MLLTQHKFHSWLKCKNISKYAWRSKLMFSWWVKQKWMKYLQYVCCWKLMKFGNNVLTKNYFNKFPLNLCVKFKNLWLLWKIIKYLTKHVHIVWLLAKNMLNMNFSIKTYAVWFSLWLIFLIIPKKISKKKKI